MGYTLLKLAQHLPIFSCLCLFILLISSASFVHVEALNIGVQATHVSFSVSVSKDCSRACESSFCSVPPFLRYGKYCGLLYGGCPGEKPCDGLDACCMQHDACIQSKNNGYLSQECSQNLLNCMQKFKKSRKPSFKGNKCDTEEVISVISAAMEAALLAGRIIHKP